MTVTELSRYSRSFNGLKSEYDGDMLDYTLFAADSHDAYVRDEIQGDGTSGLYRLSRQDIVVNSEKVTLETRDRFHSETIFNARELARYMDYSIDYDAGLCFSNHPVYSRDEAFNPVFIVVEYESGDPDDTAYNYGGRGAVKLLKDRLETGVTYIHEGPANADAHLGGLDARLELGGGIEAKAELSATIRKEDGENISGQAYLAQLSKKGQLRGQSLSPRRGRRIWIGAAKQQRIRFAQNRPQWCLALQGGLDPGW